MHHLDRALREFESGTDELEGGDFEYEFEAAPTGELELDETDYEGDYEGDFEADYEADFEGDFEGDYEGDFEEETEGDYEADYEVDFEGEYEADLEADYEADFETDFEAEYEEGEAVFDEVEEMELAAALLEVGNEQELDQFIGSVLKKAGQALGKAFGFPTGRALVSTLKGVARKVLPVAGSALGNIVAPGIGGVAGAQAAGVAGRMFGLELEGMSPQDQEFEVARRFVRLAGGAAQQMATNADGGPPDDIAKDAVMQAAQLHAPGLMRRLRRYGRRGGPYGWADGGRPGGGRRRGRWVRRGRRIILFGA